MMPGYQKLSQSNLSWAKSQGILPPMSRHVSSPRHKYIPLEATRLITLQVTLA